jgi:hypothetical protein
MITSQKRGGSRVQGAGFRKNGLLSRANDTRLAERRIEKSFAGK